MKNHFSLGIRDSGVNTNILLSDLLTFFDEVAVRVDI
jgi:hypothetical protein